MKKIFTLLAGLLIASSSFAIPAMKIWRTVKQADGTLLKVMTVGDEHFNYAMTEGRYSPCTLSWQLLLCAYRRPAVGGLGGSGT